MGLRLKKYLKIFLAGALAISLLSGCGAQPVSSNYPLESVTQNGSQASSVYRAANKTVPQVAQEIAADRKPDQMSKEDAERMFLVYPDMWYHLQRDPQKPADTLIEVSNTEYVRQNYASDFLKGYLLATLIDNLFGGRNYYPGNYRGYTTRDIYKPNTDYRPPTVQEKKSPPPITKDGTGSIIKRSDNPTDGSVGSGGSITKKEPAVPPSTGSSGKIIKSPDSGSGSYNSDPQPKSGSSFSPPKNNSPPKTRVGGSGSITKRR